MEGFEIHLHTESRVLKGRRATSGPRASQPIYPKERVCVNEGCTTTLSIYNGGQLCWQHQAPSQFVHRADRRSGGAERAARGRTGNGEPAGEAAA